MDQKQIEENNILIAEFMGHYHIKDGYYRVFPTKCVRVKGLEYHSSWDWLMKVVEKIESLKNSVTIFDVGAGIEGLLIIERFGTTKLEGTYLTVVEFIKWYNKNKKE